MQLRRDFNGGGLSQAHTTILSLYTEAGEQELVGRLGALSSARVQLDPLDAAPFDKGTMVVRYRRNVGTQGLHYAVAHALEDLVARPLAPRPAQRERVRAWRRFGSGYFGAFYQPHLSLINHGVYLQGLDVGPFGFTAQSFRLARKDRQWYEVVEEFSLPRSAQGR